MRTFEYRLYPNKEQSHLLMQCLSESRHVYNEMLETVKTQYEEKGTFPGKYTLDAAFKGRGGEHVPATTVQCLADRLTKAKERFLAAKELSLDRVPTCKRDWDCSVISDKILRQGSMVKKSP